MNPAYLRHQLIYLKKGSPVRIISEHNDLTVIAAYVSDWIALKRPFIYTRQPEQDKLIYLGLTTLLNKQKHRVALQVNSNTIEHCADLPKISAVMTCEDIDGVQVYGSYLFEYLSQQSFVNKNSDLDILLEYNHHSLRAIQKIIHTLQALSGKKIDGEVRFKSQDPSEVMDMSVQELLSNSPNLLVKTVHNVYLIPREKLYETYACLRA